VEIKKANVYAVSIGAILGKFFNTDAVDVSRNSSFERSATRKQT